MVTTQRKPKQLGQILLEQGLISEEQLERALEEHRNTPKSLGRVLIDLGYIKERDLVRALAEQVGLEFVDLTEYRSTPRRPRLLPEALVPPVPRPPDRRRRTASSWSRCRTRRTCTRSTTSARSPAGTSSRRRHAERHRAGDPQVLGHGRSGRGARVGGRRCPRHRGRPRRRSRPRVEDAPIVKFVNRDHDAGGRPTGPRTSTSSRPSSDVRVRFRVDGVLHEVMHSPKNIQAGLISRLKVMADINIAERRIPQDGRVALRVGGKRSWTSGSPRCRPSTARRSSSGSWTRANALLQLAELGFLPQAFERFEQSFRKPYGAILVTGPTGSGKSTTLYATLNILNNADRQHHHGRGPGRVPAARHQPDADEPEGGADVRLRAPIDPARRPRHHPDR